MGIRRPTAHGFGLLLALSTGCATTQLDHHLLPPLEALQSIEAGVTTRSEVLRRLGPPEEMRRPANFDRARATTPQHRRILEAGRLFDDRSYTYASASRRSLDVGLLPAGPELLRVTQTRSVEERWHIEFDENGVVSSVSHTGSATEER